MKVWILGLIGLSSGMVTSAALFALIASIGVLSRLAQITHTASRIRWYECCFMLGCTIANFMYMNQISTAYFNHGWFMIMGLFMGIYLGCFIGALTEVINVFPILFHRIHLRTGLKILVFSLAIGKTVGGFLDFFV